jgi:predicted metalloendopeptidase
MTNDLLATQIASDPHAPAKLRVNGPLSQLDSFADAFRCPASAPMRRRPACQVW